MTRPRPLSRAELRRVLVPRASGAHKGAYGHVLIVAGSRGMAGAAILATRAALRSGAGLVTAAVPEGVLSTVAAAAPSAMTLPLPENPAGAARPRGAELIADYVRRRLVTAMAVGPGLTTHPDAVRFVLAVLAGSAPPAVIDADALNALAATPEAAALLRARAHPCVLTPHAGEAARLLGGRPPRSESERLACALSLARRFGATALLKGRGTLIAGAGRVAANRPGGPGLAKAGSGDVLAGLIAGLWAQRLAAGRAGADSSFQAAALGAWLHGTAGDRLERELTPWAATSADLVERLPAAFRALRP